jgi:hypothetical protein
MEGRAGGHFRPQVGVVVLSVLTVIQEEGKFLTITDGLL